jgi:hypothetical protein
MIKKGRYRKVKIQIERNIRQKKKKEKKETDKEL